MTSTTYFHLGFGDVPERCNDINACVHQYPANRHTTDEFELFTLYGFDMEMLPQPLSKR